MLSVGAAVAFVLFPLCRFIMDPMLTGKLTRVIELTQPQRIASPSAVRSLAAALQPDALQTPKQPSPSVLSIGALPQLDIVESLQALASAFAGCGRPFPCGRSFHAACGPRSLLP